MRAFIEVGDSFVVLSRGPARPGREEFERKLAGPLRRLVENGQSSGEIRGDVPSSWLTESLVGLVVSVRATSPALAGRTPSPASRASSSMERAPAAHARHEAPRALAPAAVAANERRLAWTEATRRRVRLPFKQATATTLSELVEYLRDNRSELREEWARRITDAHLLGAMTADEIFSEVTAVYDNYVSALETGSVETLQAYARDLSERIIPRGVETHEVLGIVLLLRDVLARSLFQNYQHDWPLLNRILDAYEPAANRIAVTVGASPRSARGSYVSRRRRSVSCRRRSFRCAIAR